LFNRYIPTFSTLKPLTVDTDGVVCNSYVRDEHTTTLHPSEKPGYQSSSTTAHTAHWHSSKTHSQGRIDPSQIRGLLWYQLITLRWPSVTHRLPRIAAVGKLMGGLIDIFGGSAMVDARSSRVSLEISTQR
jgi:hypothetical protein